MTTDSDPSVSPTDPSGSTKDAPASVAAEQPDLLDTLDAGPAAIRGSFVRTAGYVLGLLLSLVSAPLLIRHLGFGEYGRYVIVINLVTIVQGVTDVGLGQIGVREFATRPEAARAALMRNLLGLRIALTATGVALATGFAALAGYGHTVLLGTLFAGIAMVLTVVQGTFQVPLAARLKLGWVTALELLRQALTVLGIVILVIAGATLLPFLVITLPVALVVLAATIAVARGATPLQPSLQGSEWLLLIRSVLPFAAAVAVGTLYLRITVVLMSLLTTKLQVGYYGTSYTVVSVLIAIPALTVGSTLPILARAARDDHERLGYVLQRLFEVTLIVGVWLSLALALGAGFVINVLSGENATTPIHVLQIQSIAMVTQFVATSWQYGLLSLHRHRALLGISLGSLVASVGLTLILVPLLEARGAAIAFASAEVALAVSSFVLLRIAQPGLRFSARVPVRVLLAAAAAGLIALAPDLSSLERALIASAIYLAMLVALRAIPAELIEAALHRPRHAG